jgi:GTP-binding protein HflX
MATSTEAPRPRTVLVGVQLPDVTDAELRSSLNELKRLCKTLGLEVVGEVTQKRQGLGAATLLGAGKLVELAAWTGGTGVVPKGPPGKRRATAEEEQADEEDEDQDDTGALDVAAPPAPIGGPRATVVVVDHELSPRQLRHIEAATSASVLDRTGVIIEIFHRHASSRPARLQVEIARHRARPGPPSCARTAPRCGNSPRRRPRRRRERSRQRCGRQGIPGGSRRDAESDGSARGARAPRSARARAA